MAENRRGLGRGLSALLGEAEEIAHAVAPADGVREIPIGPQAQVVLTPYLERSAEEFCFSPQDSERARRNLRRQQRITPLTQGNRSGTNRRAKPSSATFSKAASCSIAN